MAGNGGRVGVATTANAFVALTTADGLIDDDINEILEDENGTLWIGTEGGISKYDGETFTNFGVADGLPDQHVNGMALDRDGRIWACTLAGVTCFDGSSFSTLTTADGLASDAVLRVFQDSNGYMWFATWGGLNRYDGEVFQILTQEDGLASSTVMKFFEEEDGRLWCGTGSGATCCRLPAPTPPPVYIRAVVADRRYTSLDAVSIPSSAGLTAVEFHGINFKTRPGAMIYRYRLKGHSEEWKTTHARRVEYQDLEPGSYSFSGGCRGSRSELLDAG